VNLEDDRVDGKLSVTRTLGAPYFKGRCGDDGIGSSRRFPEGLVIARPTCHCVPITQSLQGFILGPSASPSSFLRTDSDVASDGVWDALSPQQCVAVLGKRLSAGASVH